MDINIASTSSDKAEDLISTFLAEHYTGILATSDTASNPHGAVIYYLPDSDFTLYFATKEETQKFKNMEENPQVAFVVYDETSQTSLQVSGRIFQITDPLKKRATIKNMTNSSIVLSRNMLPPAYKLTAGEYKVLQLVPQVIKMAIYARTDKDQDIYETIIFNDSQKK